MARSGDEAGLEMKVAALQMDIAWEDRQRNYDRVAGHADRAMAEGAALLVLPEMFSTGFSMDTTVTAETMDGPTVSFVRELAASRRMAVIAGVALSRPGGRAANCAVVVGADGELVACYAKMRLFSFAGEDQHHVAGPGPVLFELNGVRGACFICYDLRFPSLFRSVAAQCDAIFVIASWPEPRRGHWEILLPARAVENQLYVVGVNRIGSGGGQCYKGGSQIIDPNGEVLTHAGEREGLITADLDRPRVERTRKAMPFLRDRNGGHRS